MDRLVIHYNLTHSQLAERLRQAAGEGGCSLMTSRLESFGLAASESIACRLPVVAPRVGALPEQVRDAETGFLFEFGERERAAALISKLLFDKSLRERIDRCLRAGDPTQDRRGEQAFRDHLLQL